MSGRMDSPPNFMDRNRDQDSAQTLLDSKNVSRASNGNAREEKAMRHDYDRLQEKLARITCYLYGLATIVVFGMLILIVIIAVLYGKLSYDVAHHSHQPKVGEQISKILEDEELCFLCSTLKLGPSPQEEHMLDPFIRKDDKDGEQCCVESPSQLMDLLKLFIERKYREEMAKGNIKLQHNGGLMSDEDRPAAHLMGSLQRLGLNQVPGKQFPISSWVYETDLAFTNHVTYRHGRIVVPTDGLYYVYSQISFLEVFDPLHGDGSQSNPSSTSTESPSLSHYIYRYNIIYPLGGEEPLVQNSITKCWGQNKAFGEYVSYLGAVFNLRQGDEVFVKVSNLSMVAREPKSNYFGLFKL
ncbi:tumor necrosis factor ligand superfamily member 10-like [Gigantopelta aegis]|uniref:tumor necrosis factor ligand superfamily member 10-like n=1 Tax=Gigantopelta aegis TaxID=1735272 RepID=UPI001B88A0BC|nr:tumor necrosis factor ligand superfamily member 10-like [Gigantopelta aegis]